MALSDRRRQKPSLPNAPEGHEWVFHEITFEPLLWNPVTRRVDRELTTLTLESHHKSTT